MPSTGVRLIVVSVTCGLLAAAPVAAQTPAQTPTAPPNVVAPQPTDQAAGSVASAPVTLTGCLERGKAASAEQRPGAPPLPGAAQTSFVLRTFAAADSASAGAKPQSKADQPVVYSLVAAKEDVRLEPHVGHKVTITGTLRAATNQQPGMTNQGVSPSVPSGSTGMETAPRPAGDPAGATSGAVPAITQPIFVESLTMVDANCPAGK